MANYTILLIDYEPRSIERFRDPLTAAGYAVEIATDGVSGIEAFHRLNPDMVLVEAMIPKKHGFEVCQELKRTPHGRRTPVIITTGVYKGRKYRTQALHIYGCDEYIEKPIASEQLLEVVGKFFVAGSPGSSGSSGSSPKRSESGPANSEPGTGSSARKPADAISKTSPAAESRTFDASRTQPIFIAPAVIHSDTEGEIMARLDEIMPGARPAPKLAPPATGHAADPSEANPFAQMRAELDAELGAITGPLAFEIAPNLVPPPDSIPSDQVAAPTVLETLPVPEAPIPLAPMPAGIPVSKEEAPGQVVSFDSTRSRKNRKDDKKAKGTAPQSGPMTLPKAPVANRTESPKRVTRAISRGTNVESEFEPAPTRRGRPVVLWLALGAVALATIYLLLPRGDVNESTYVPAPKPVPKSEPIAPPVAEPNPVANAPVEPPPQTAEAARQTPDPGPAVPEPPKAGPVPVATKATTPKKAPGRASTTTTSDSATAEKKSSAIPVPKPAAAPPKATKRATPEGAPAAPAKAAAAAPQPAATAPPESDATAGAGASPDTASPASAATIARGTLIPIDLADTLPVQLTHRSPFYSMEAIQNRVSGTVIMNVLINHHGTVDQVVLVSGIAGSDVNDAAIRAARSWTYRPATKGGVAVKVWLSEQVVVKP